MEAILNKTKERFYNKIMIPDENGCMNFKGSLNSSGYGKIVIDGKLVLAHRFSYSLHKGNIPVGMYVLHKCDNRKCVAPEHLFLGSNIDNMKDMIEKGRDHKNPAFGENHHKTTLTNIQVLEIKKLLTTSMSIREIADKFSVRYQVIISIKKGRRWNRISKDTTHE